LEAWFPGYKSFRELCSLSNCTDYQSRSINIRLRTDIQREGTEKKYVHMLNGTLCAAERTLCCILENYQTKTGVRVPTVLIPYVGTDFIPYKEELLPGYKKEKKKENTGKKNDKDKDKDKENKKEKTDKDKKEKKEDNVNGGNENGNEIKEADK
jgi:hypothetical protein